MLIGVRANTASSKPKRSSEITVQQPDRLNPPDIRTAGIRMVPEDADRLQAGLGLTWDKDAVERYRVC